MARILQAHSALIYNLGIIGLERLLQLVGNLFCLRLITQSVSLADGGRYHYALSLSVIFVTLSFYAGSEVMLPKLSRYKNLQANLMTTGILLRCMYAVLSFTFASIFAFAAIADVPTRSIFLCFAIAPLTMEVAAMMGCWLVTEQKNSFFSFARLIGLASRILAIAYLAWQKNTDIITFIYPYILEGLVGAWALWRIYQKKSRALWGRWHKALAKILVRDGIWIGLGLTCSFLFQKLDRILLESRLSLEALGIYGSAMQLNDAWISIAIMMCSIAAPALLFKVRDHGLAKRRLWQVCGIFAALGLCGALFIYVFAEYLVTFLLDVRYQSGVIWLKWWAYLAPLIFVHHWCLYWWLREKKYTYFLSIWLLGVAVMAVVFYLPVSIDHPIKHMFVATLVAYISMLILQYRLYQKNISIKL